MSFDPSKPGSGTPLSSAEMRAQLTALTVPIDGVPTLTGAAVDSITLGSGTSVSVALIAGILHFDFMFQPGPAGK